jgi:prefoldin subunit 5
VRIIQNQQNKNQNPNAQTQANQYYAQQYWQQQQNAILDQVEVMVETIVNEKWEDFEKNLNKITEWKEKVDSSINRLEQELKDVKDTFDKLQKALIGKIAEYDKNIINVGIEIKAMEKVFQKILPVFTDNVNELARITKQAKKTFPSEEEQ